ncbi:MAG: glycosyltransferase [Patescibacteria group bacterium]|jgi:glycosyltransferase involved in cell wall biosynthesis
MKIALVHDWLTVYSGAERVLLALSEIYPEAEIYTSVYDPVKVTAFRDKKVHTSFLQKIPLMKKKRELLIPLTPFAFEQFDFSKYDIVISSTTFPAKGIITKPDTLHVSYCHTPTRYIWEPHLDPRAAKGKFKGLRDRVMHQLRIWDFLAADRVDYFLANSKYVANRIQKYYRRDSDVIYPPVDVDNFTPAPKEEIGDYFLFVSRLVDYKRCDVAIRAFNELGLPLKIVGYGPDEAKLKAIAKSNIEFAGGKFGKELQDIFARARAFVFMAEEDFGIVPVEAMACGRPVICYSKGGQAESAIPGTTGILFDEQTPESLIEAVKSFKVEDYDPIKIRRQAENFSKDRFKREIEEKVEELMKEYKK